MSAGELLSKSGSLADDAQFSGDAEAGASVVSSAVRYGCGDVGSDAPAPGRRYCVREKVSPPTGKRAGVSQGDRSLSAPVRQSLPSPVVHVRGYAAANWFTVEGVRAKRRLIERRGLPRMKYWRFITLTLDRSLFAHDPLGGYLAGKQWMRNFLHACRKAGLWKPNERWAWKLEFQADGWAHWHLLVGRKKKFSSAELATLRKLWKLGRTNVEMIAEDGFGYPFKYAFKPVSQAVEGYDPDDTGDDFAVPEWFLDYYSRDKDGQPVTFQRVRFWQTCKGFYTGDADALPEDDEEGEPEDSEVEATDKSDRCPFPWTARENLQRQRETVQVISRKSSGKYIGSSVVRLVVAPSLFWALVGSETIRGEAVGLAAYSYVIPAELIKRTTLKTCRTSKLLQETKLSLRRARMMRDSGETLRTC